MENIQDLCKHKHIYRLYRAVDGRYNIERYPVIYINSKVVYYKDKRKGEYLSNTSLSMVGPVLNKNKLHLPMRREMFYWEIGDPHAEIFEEILKTTAIGNSIRDKRLAFAEVNNARLMVEQALKKAKALGVSDGDLQ